MIKTVNLLKNIVKKTPIYPFLHKIILEGEKRKIISKWNKLERQKEDIIGEWKKNERNKSIIIRNWEKKGRPIPPPSIIKQKTVKEYANKFSIDVLIETGTYLGEMIFAMKDVFVEIYSIELDSYLYRKAKERFISIPNIHILQGDSSIVLPSLFASIKQPSLFWLDAHYSGGATAKGNLNTPIFEELNHIFNHYVNDHVILIDDARDFTGKEYYPTINTLKEFVVKNRPDYLFEVKNDIIRIHKHIPSNISKDKFKKMNK